MTSSVNPVRYRMWSPSSLTMKSFRFVFVVFSMFMGGYFGFFSVATNHYVESLAVLRYSCSERCHLYIWSSCQWEMKWKDVKNCSRYIGMYMWCYLPILIYTKQSVYTFRKLWQQTKRRIECALLFISQNVKWAVVSMLGLVTKETLFWQISKYLMTNSSWNKLQLIMLSDLFTFLYQSWRKKLPMIFYRMFYTLLRRISNTEVQYVLRSELIPLVM